MQQSSQHISALDGLRAVAASMVFLCHTVGSLMMPAGLQSLIFGGPVAMILNTHGAVQLFFLLSGYCLASSATRASSVIGLSQFYVRRLFRIHPPYVFAFLFAWLASFFYSASNQGGGLTPWPFLAWASVHLDAPQLFRSFLFPGPAHGQLPVGWSLGVEMFFSFLLPLMMFVARRSHWLVLLIASIYVLARPDTPGVQGLYLQYSIDFSLGLAIYLERDRLARFFRSIPRAVAALIMLLSLSVFTVPVMLPRDSGSLAVFLTGCGGAGLIMGAIFVPRVSRLLSLRPIVFLGRISYSFYLLHVTVLILCGRLVSTPLGPGEAAAFLTLVFALSVVISAIAYRYVERPSIRVGDVICTLVGRYARQPAQLSRLAF